ncbi:PepSY-associated TM helix domain-containing protein [Streptomyces paludis]|uniref:PepSY domain-containing protein n=1 Tax=Streptomyces paludis TaxID=2282738 RepID=A0A345HLB0_9ACTN|nr:PepSY domain-containing protein [Streptomyces paludis]AXG77484.1 PepSY domain-containing protein [Streptomyces paludis]
MAIDDPVQGTGTDDETAAEPKKTATEPKKDPAEPKKTPAAPPSGAAAGASGTPRASGWSALRPLVLRLHFYAGLLIAPLLLVAATSGFLYSLSFQAEKVIYRHELRAPVGDRVQPVADQIAAARAAHPEGTVTSVRLPSEKGETTKVMMSAPGLKEHHSLAVFVDPYTAEVRGALDTYGSSLALPVRGWLSEFHRHLQLGEPGLFYSELAASWLWVVALGGLFLWIGRKRASKRALILPERGTTGRRRTLSLHGTLGLWAVTGLVLLSATGLTWSKYAGANISEIKDQLGSSTPSVSASLDGGGSGGGDDHSGHGSGASMPGMDHSADGEDIGVDLAVVAARQAGLDGPIQVTLPTEGVGYVIAETDRQFPVRLDSIAVDPANGKVIDELRFADYPLLAKLTRIGIDAHTGVYLGMVNQLALAALAVSLIVLIIWGYRMWWLRRPTKERAFSAGRPIPRGAWRKVPLTLLLPLVAVTALVGWFLPLLGISLLVFLVVDGVLGVVARARKGGNGEKSGKDVPVDA